MTAEEIFNMFFGGGMPGSSGKRVKMLPESYSRQGGGCYYLLFGFWIVCDPLKEEINPYIVYIIPTYSMIQSYSLHIKKKLFLLKGGIIFIFNTPLIFSP